jgi:hypothetical protein
MDLVLVSSNMRQMTRLQLLVEVGQRVWRMSVEEDQACYAAAFQPYRQGTEGQYCCRVRGDEVATHVEAVGQLMHRLVEELAARLGTDQEDRSHRVAAFEFRRLLMHPHLTCNESCGIVYVYH